MYRRILRIFSFLIFFHYVLTKTYDTVDILRGFQTENKCLCPFINSDPKFYINDPTIISNSEFIGKLKNKYILLIPHISQDLSWRRRNFILGVETAQRLNRTLVIPDIPHTQKLRKNNKEIEVTTYYPFTKLFNLTNLNKVITYHQFRCEVGTLNWLLLISKDVKPRSRRVDREIVDEYGYVPIECSDEAKSILSYRTSSYQLYADNVATSHNEEQTMVKLFGDFPVHVVDFDCSHKVVLEHSFRKNITKARAIAIHDYPNYWPPDNDPNKVPNLKDQNYWMIRKKIAFVPEITHEIRSYIKRTFAGASYLAIYWKDFKSDGIDDLAISPDTVIRQVKPLLEEHNIQHVFLVTDFGNELELGRLKTAFGSLYRFRIPPNSELARIPPSIGLIEQGICARAKIFMGTAYSLITVAIREERHILLKRPETSLLFNETES